MANKHSSRANSPTSGQPPTKKQLQREMQRTRESVAETVEEIKQTVTDQYTAAKETVAGVLDYRDQFQKEPLVWSLGALSAGFALGYTLGYAHKETKNSKNKSEIGAFANSMIDELSVIGGHVVMPKLNEHVRELFGFSLSDVIDTMGKKPKPTRKLAAKASKSRRKKKAAKKS